MNSHRDMIIDTLAGAGWNKTDKAKLVSMAEMEYDNGQMHLEIEHDPSDDSVIFRIFGLNGELFLVAYYENKLSELLQAITSIQEDLSEQNYQECIRQILNICPIFVDTEEGLVPLP